MRRDYQKWLVEQGLAKNTIQSRVANIRTVGRYYGDLQEFYERDKFEGLLAELKYTAEDERYDRPNPSKIPIYGNIRNGLATYKGAVRLYKEFLNEFSDGNIEQPSPQQNQKDVKAVAFGLERDMQAALRRNIQNLDSGLEIIDDGAEQIVDSGRINITCKDNNNNIVVIELKSGKADSRAISQILGYMGDIIEEKETGVRGILVAHDFDKRSKAAARIIPALKLKKYSEETGVRGILVAHDFDKRTKAAARIIPTLKLKKYSIEFKFTSED